MNEMTMESICKIKSDLAPSTINNFSLENKCLQNLETRYVKEAGDNEFNLIFQKSFQTELISNCQTESEYEDSLLYILECKSSVGSLESISNNNDREKFNIDQFLDCC